MGNMMFMIFLFFFLNFGKHNVQVIQTTAYFNFMFSQYWAKMSDYWCVGLSNRWTIATHPTILQTKLHRKYIFLYCIVFFPSLSNLKSAHGFCVACTDLNWYHGCLGGSKMYKGNDKKSNMMRRNERETHTPWEREPFDPPRACLKTAKLCLL